MTDTPSPSRAGERLPERLLECVKDGPDSVTPDLLEEAAEALRTTEQERDALRQPLVERYACQRCGRRDGLDAVVTESEWQEISQGRWNILCLWCMDALALEAGLSAGVALYFAGRALHGVMEHATAEAIDMAARAALRRAEQAESQLTARDQTIAQLREAVEAIRTACRGDAKGEWWTLREWLNKRGVYNDDISGGKRLVEIACVFALTHPADGPRT